MLKSQGIALQCNLDFGISAEDIAKTKLVTKQRMVTYWMLILRLKCGRQSYHHC